MQLRTEQQLACSCISFGLNYLLAVSESGAELIGCTPVVKQTAAEGNLPAVEQLLSAGHADRTVQDRYGRVHVHVHAHACLLLAASNAAMASPCIHLTTHCPRQLSLLLMLLPPPCACCGRWGNTPLDEARRVGATAVCSLLEEGQQ